MRELQTRPIRARENLGFARVAAAPDRPDGVDDVPSGQVVPSSDLRGARRRYTERARLLEQPRAGRAMDRAIDTATAQQRRVRRVDDRVDGQRRDVAADDLRAYRRDDGSRSA